MSSDVSKSRLKNEEFYHQHLDFLVSQGHTELARSYTESSVILRIYSVVLCETLGIKQK